MSATLQAIDWQVGDGWQPLIDAWRASADGQRALSIT